MFFAHDPDRDFFYCGETEPHSKLYQELVNSNPKLIAVDTETISLKERIAIGVGIAFTPQDSLYFPLFPDPSPVVPWHLLQDPSITKVFHNALFDLACMREYEIDTINIKDTSVMAHLLCLPDARLATLAQLVDMEVHTVQEFLGHGQIMLDLDKPTVARKCCQDCLATLALYHHFLPDIDVSYFNMEMELIPILITMSEQGLLIDQEARGKLERKLEPEVDYYIGLCDGEGFNPGSPQQVAYILAKRGAYSVFAKIPFTRKHKSIRTDKEILSKMDDPMAAIVLNYRDKSYLLSHYIRPWAKEDRAYTKFHLNAITGRISSTDRNLQNIPKGESRGIFLPDNGVWTDIDFSQLELRTLAYLSGDKEMQYIFSLPRFNPDGSPNKEADIHQHTADFLGIERRPAKSVDFAMVYGATDDTIAETAGIRSIGRVRELKERWFQLYREAGGWIQSVQLDALNYPFAKTLFGRRIRLPTIEEEDSGSIMRKAIDYPNQGSAAEILKRALIISKGLPMSLQVHDEILFDGKVELPDGLEHIAPFHTPISIKYLQRWE